MISVREKIVNNDADTWMQVALTHEYIPLKEQNWSERWCTLLKVMTPHLHEISEFKLRKDDVFLTGFTKSGTTWMQETLWLLMNGLDFEHAKVVDVKQRVFALELFAVELTNNTSSLEVFENLPSPRIIKSHMPLNLLPKKVWAEKQKIIYVARNPKDVFVSSFHYYKNLGAWTDNMDKCVDTFISDEFMYAPMLPHVVDFWKLRNESHVFFVTYEDMKRDLASVIKRLCVFLERPQLTEEEMKKILDHLSFDNIKGNKQTNANGFYQNLLQQKLDKNFQFMRRGIVGSYKDELSEENQKKLNDWIKTSLAKFGVKEEDIFGKI